MYQGSQSCTKSQTTGPVFTKLVRIRIRLKLKILLLWAFFETYYNFITIDCWYLIIYILQTRLLGFFRKENIKLYSCDLSENLSPLNNRIIIIIVNYSYAFYVLNNIYHVNGYTNQVFLNR